MESVSADPTKEFFIYMLIKDINLIHTIPDLVDNCVDGARKMGYEDRLDGLWVKVEVDKNHFKIIDNCGGIDLTTARDVAFKFGRPKTAEYVKGSVGLFGVGMKRAIFKLGKAFKIESRTVDSYFIMQENVEEWVERPTDWTFQLDNLGYVPENTELQEEGTLIEVTPLHEIVSLDFSLETYRTRLRSALEARHFRNIEKGLTIYFNGEPLKPLLFNLLQSDKLKPAYEQYVWPEASEDIGYNQSAVTVKVYAGISDSEPADSGWNVFCNGRLILWADKSMTTGWNDGLPAFHPQYSRFRGYVFFESPNPSLLPWNTTKDGIDEDSPLFRKVRLDMIRLAKPVFTFLNAVKKEKQQANKVKANTGIQANVTSVQHTTLEEAINSATSVKVLDLTLDKQTFVAPIAKAQTDLPELANILYSRPIEQVEKAKAKLKVQSYKEVGERTFDYYYVMECED